jgi:tetratricopeptide (TPR) repeat protein
MGWYRRGETVPSQDRQPVHLTLRRTGDVITADLAETGVLIPRSETHVDDAFLDELVAEMGRVALVAAQRGEGAAGGGERGLARVGGLIFSHLLTEQARRCLTETPTTNLYLRLDERLVHVPWELCHDGEDFLISKFRIGRQVITAQPIPESQGTASRKGLRMLLVADPTETLPHAVAEAERLCSLLDAVPGIEVTLLAGKSVRRVALLGALQEHDVVHFAGHSHYDAAVPSRSGWRLAEGILTAAELAKLRPPPFLVFSNSCEAATSASWGPRAGYEPQAFGIGSAFLLAGVPNYVGTFWVLHDAESLDFATACHRALVSGASLGESLAEARRAVIAAHGRDGLTWASYSLYGDPAFRPLDTGTARAPEPTALRSAPAREAYRFEVSLGATRERAPQVGRVAEGPRIVGRDADLARLDIALRAAHRGERGVWFVSGPPGMGKTALVETLASRVRADGEAWVAHGQAIEQYGSGEAYLPILEALGRLGREPEGNAVVALLRRHAPTWLAQLPGLVAPAEHETLLRWAQASTRERMLRELAELFEAIAREHPVVLLLEDLHWSDHSTLESIAYLAQRREPARLLVIGTYRAAEVSTGEHPLRAITQELRARRQSEEIRLEPLDEDAIAAYLRARLGPAPVDAAVPRLIFQRTEGHPLFFVSMVDYALREGLLAEERGRWRLREGAEALALRIPDGLRPMIERQVETLSPEEQSVLEAAGVVGAEFSIAEVAAALDAEPEEIDDRCEALAWRGQLLRSVGVDEWPDGTLGGRYRFTHALYQNVLYDRVAPARRMRLHRRIGERKEAAFGARSGEIAGELAAHFEAARDTHRAVAHRIRAGEVAVRRHADREAIDHFRRALALLPRLGDRAERSALELSILVKLATPLMSTEGYAAADVGAVFERAHALSRQVAPGPHLAPLLRGLMSFYQVRARCAAAEEVGEELLALCERGDADATARVQAHYGHGVTLYDRARLEPARVHLERALELYDPESHATHVEVYGGYDPGAGSLAWLGWIQWLRGFPDRAIESARRACDLAAKLDHRFSTTFTCLAIAVVHLYRGEVDDALPFILRGREISRDDGFAYQGAVLAGTHGWASLAQGRTDEALGILEESIRAQKATGAEAALPAYLRLLAYAELRRGDPRAGLGHVKEGLEIAERNQDWLFVCQMRRSHGELLLACGDEATFGVAEAAHRSDLALARELQVPMFEIEAVAGLARFLMHRGRREDARDLLAPVCERLAGSVEDVVLRDVRQLLAAC